MEILTLIVTVIIFLISAIFNNFSIIDDRKKRWYVEIIINPNLILIDKFFEDILLKFKENKEFLNTNYSDKNSINYREEKGLKLKELTEFYKKFHFKIIPLLSSYNSQIASDLNICLEEFRDFYTKNIGLDTNLTNKEITNTLLRIKQDFYKNLYDPVKNTYFNSVRIERVLLLVLLTVFVLLFSIDSIKNIFI